MEEKIWHIKAGSVASDDPLLGCLVILTRIEQRPHSAETLSAGLPLVDNKLTPELFVRAAKRADLSAQVVRRELKDISSLVLPCVLMLKNKQACILLSYTKKGTAKIIQPETGEGITEIKKSQLLNKYIGHAIFIRPAYKFEERTEINGVYDKSHWFWSVIKKIIPFYLDIIIASMLINFFALSSPLFTMNVYDRVVPNNAMETLMVLALGITTVYIFDFIMKTLRSYFIDVAGKKADILLQANIFEQMLGIKLEARPQSVGSFANNISQFDAFRDFMTSATIVTIIDLPFVIIFVSVMYFIGGGLMVLVPICAIPIILIVGITIQRPLESVVKQSYRYGSQKQAMLIESLVGIEHIKTSGAESAIQKQWEHLGGISSKCSMQVKILSTLANNTSAFINQLSSILIVVFGVHLITEGTMTMGALIACNMLNSRTLAPMGQITGLITRYHQSITSFKSVDNVMKMPVEHPPGKTPLHRPHLNGDIEFKNVSFKYPNEEKLSLDDVSFRVYAGEKVGIIGRIGSGKTTIEKLILGLYETTEGSVLFDGTESKQLDPTIIRRNIGYVPQDVNLFYGSVKDNIVMGAAYADDTTILRAASISGVTEFVSNHPKGFDLPVGERGIQLSGGQRQSIAVARALLLDPKILVFDEPTNMMDTRTEEILKIKLQANIKDKTLILVTHKGSLLSLVDRLIVVSNGKISADGPRDEIVKKLSEGKIELV